jgi:hypothetical protein
LIPVAWSLGIVRKTYLGRYHMNIRAKSNRVIEKIPRGSCSIPVSYTKRSNTNIVSIEGLRKTRID